MRTLLGHEDLPPMSGHAIGLAEGDASGAAGLTIAVGAVAIWNTLALNSLAAGSPTAPADSLAAAAPARFAAASNPADQPHLGRVPRVGLGRVEDQHTAAQM